MTKIDLNLLRSKWSAEDITESGRYIYEAVPNDQRPDWAGAILLYVAGEESLCDELARVVDISFAEAKSIWITAHDAFQAVRLVTLRNEKTNREGTHQQLILDIGETTAKVIYNASGGSAPFNHHAGWRMASRVKKLVDLVGKQEFEDNCWRLLIRRMAE